MTDNYKVLIDINNNLRSINEKYIKEMLLIRSSLYIDHRKKLNNNIESLIESENLVLDQNQSDELLNNYDNAIHELEEMHLLIEEEIRYLKEAKEKSDILYKLNR